MNRTGAFVNLRIQFTSKENYERWRMAGLNPKADYVVEALEIFKEQFDQHSNLFDNSTDLSTSKGNSFEEAWEYLKGMGFDLEEEDVSKKEAVQQDGQTWWKFWLKGDLRENSSVEDFLKHTEEVYEKREEMISWAFDAQKILFSLDAYLSEDGIFEYAEPLAMLCIEARRLGEGNHGKACIYPDYSCGMLYDVIFFDSFYEIFSTKITDIQNVGETQLDNFWYGYDTSSPTFDQYMKWLESDEEKAWDLKTAGNYGFVNAKGEWAIKPEYPEAANFVEGLALVKDPEKYTYGYINPQGEYAIPPRFQFGHGFYQGMAKVMEKSKYGFIDTKGNYLIKPQWEEVDKFYEGRALISIKNEKDITLKGYINTQGEVVIPPQFAEAYYFSCGRALVMNGSAYHTDGSTLCAYIDDQGNFLSDFIFQQAWYFYEEVAPVKIKNVWGMVDKDMKYLLEPQFDAVWYMNKGYALIQKGMHWGFVNHQGEIILKPNHYDAMFHDPHESNEEVVFIAKKGSKFGFVNQQGELLGKIEYEECAAARNNRMAFKKGKLWGFMNIKGEVLIEPRFIQVAFFGNGAALVKDSKKNVWGMIDALGNWILEPSLDLQDAGSFAPNGLTYIQSGRGYGLINQQGQIILEPKYERVDSYGEELILVKRWS